MVLTTAMLKLFLGNMNIYLQFRSFSDGTCCCNPPWYWRQWDIYHAHDDVIKWKYFPRYWPFVRGIHRPPVNSPHKGQWRGTLMFSLICAWINDWVNNREASDLRRHRAHYDITAMMLNTLVHDNLRAQGAWELKPCLQQQKQYMYAYACYWNNTGCWFHSHFSPFHIANTSIQWSDTAMHFC